MTHPYFTAKAEAVFKKAGGDPAAAGHLAAWAEEHQHAKERGIGLLVSEDGTIHAHLTKDRVAWVATAPQTPAARAALGTLPRMSDVACAEISRELRDMGTPQHVIEVYWSDVCSGTINGKRAPKKPQSRYIGPYAAATRHRLGLSQQEFANLLGIDRTNIKVWEAYKSGAGAGVAADIETLVAQHDAEAEAMLERARRGEVVALPRGPMPQGWYVALAARVITEMPDASLGWEPPA